MSRVSQILTAAHGQNDKVQTVSPGTTITEAVRIAKEKNIGALPVLAEGRLVGIITERDFAFNVLGNNIDPNTATVGQFMTPDPAYVTPFTDLIDCLGLMETMKIRHLPVLDEGKLVGIVSLRDVLVVILRHQTLLAEQFQQYILGTR